MADEPATEQEPVVEESNAEPEQPESTEPEQTEPRYMTPEEVAEAVSRGTNEIKTWMGRRDKDLFNQIGSIIDQRMAKKSETPEEISSKLLEDPITTIKEIMNETQAQQTTQLQTHHSETFNYLGNMMDSDPLYEDKDLGNELIAEVKKQFTEGRIDTSLSPKAAAKLLHAEALANVMRNKRKNNPLTKNTPASSIGSLQPGVPTTTPKPKAPKLDPETLKWAQKWGYSDEDLTKLYAKS
jgi:DNA-directed RNA polymerase subunit F